METKIQQARNLRAAAWTIYTGKCQRKNKLFPKRGAGASAAKALPLGSRTTLQPLPNLTLQSDLGTATAPRALNRTCLDGIHTFFCKVGKTTS